MTNAQGFDLAEQPRARALNRYAGHLREEQQIEGFRILNKQGRECCRPTLVTRNGLSTRSSLSAGALIPNQAAERAAATGKKQHSCSGHCPLQHHSTATAYNPDKAQAQWPGQVGCQRSGQGWTSSLRSRSGCSARPAAASWQPSPSDSSQQHHHQHWWLEADSTSTDGEADAVLQAEAAKEQ